MPTLLPSSGREYRVPVQTDLLRSFSNPHNTNVRIIHAYVRVADFPHSLVPDEINPRRHEKLSGGIPDRIEDTLKTSPEWFHLLNRGILIIAQKAWYDNKQGTLHFEIGSEAEGGLADGATTDRVLGKVKSSISKADFEKLTSEEIPDYLKQAYVHIEIISGIGTDLLVPLTDARNHSLQVKEFALEDLRGGYNALKEVLDASKYKDKIRYKENDYQPVDIRTVLGILTLFHPKWDESGKEPTVAYTSKGSVLSYFQDEEWKKGYEALAPVAVDILDLHNYVHENFPTQYQKAYGPGSRLGARSEVKFKDGKPVASHPLLFEKVVYGLPDGWTYPLLAAFRPLLEWPRSSRGNVQWGADPKAVFDKHGAELIEDLVEFSQSQGRNANATGKQKVIWKMLRAAIENYKNSSSNSSQQ